MKFSCLTRQDSVDEPSVPRRKMVIVGDGECGKTCLVKRMATGSFTDMGYLPTVFETEVVNVHTGGEEVELVIYDTAGQEDYDRLRPFSYSNVDVVLICFSIAEPDSLANVEANWAPEISYFCTDVPVILVGNKKDLREGLDKPKSPSTESIDKLYGSLPGHANKSFQLSREYNISLTTGRQTFNAHAPVKHSEGATTAKRINAAAYFETSAMTGENVDELLLATTKAAVLGSNKSKKFKPFAQTLKSWKSKSALNR